MWKFVLCSASLELTSSQTKEDFTRTAEACVKAGARATAAINSSVADATKAMKAAADNCAINYFESELSTKTCNIIQGYTLSVIVDAKTLDVGLADYKSVILNYSVSGDLVEEDLNSSFAGPQAVEKIASHIVELITNTSDAYCESLENWGSTLAVKVANTINASQLSVSGPIGGAPINDVTLAEQDNDEDYLKIRQAKSIDSSEVIADALALHVRHFQQASGTMHDMYEAYLQMCTAAVLPALLQCVST